ncbi:hypothetical protein LTR36_008128 [Oleoguttula mirabilis]|uniref:Non-structural maintenance of chromosomes element 4 n=1 Tax=Oleoguttula mirabilis TaxID=1507867 RepID=A0AAV9J8J6_9PEZI|nr:hypothetical protein LTR36_008128 [Oleoguttula mirabilis]
MARLNTRPSATPSARFDSATPHPADSDQENRDPGARARAKGKERAMAPPPARKSLPTPTSDPSDASRGRKRKRVAFPATQTEQDEDEDEDVDEVRFKRYFDPHQDPEVRRQIKRKSRALERDFLDTRDELDGARLTDVVNKANELYKEVKQTNDATSDARLLVSVSDLAYKKTAQLVMGDASTGVDVDEFLSKCITFMRNGGPSNSQDDDAPSTSRRRRTRNRDDEDVDDDEQAGQPLDWELLGRHACFPHNARPPVPNFLLGPLSVEKKQRTQTQRRPKEAKDTTGREARPEALTKDDLEQTNENELTQICTRVRTHLGKHIRKGEQLLRRAGFTPEDDGTEKQLAMLKKCRMSSDHGVSLFDYVINPRSFGQTVENIFYISFLIKEGAVGISQDYQGLPTLQPAQATSLEEQRDAKTRKHQAVLAIDYATWEELVKAFDIREPMIPHRDDEQPTQVGERGWYA